jgi:hypothetical protein
MKERYALAWLVRFFDDGNAEGEYLLPFSVPTSEGEARFIACGMWHTMVGTHQHMPAAVIVMPMPRTECTADGQSIDDE